MQYRVAKELSSLNLVFRQYYFWSKILDERHLGSSTAANWVSFDLNISCSSCWGYSLINTLKLKKKNLLKKLLARHIRQRRQRQTQQERRYNVHAYAVTHAADREGIPERTTGRLKDYECARVCMWGRETEGGKVKVVLAPSLLFVSDLDGLLKAATRCVKTWPSANLHDDARQ